jgi:lysyl oxidase
MRWLVVLLFAAAGLALGTAGLLLLRDDGPDELLPDLDQAVPSKLEIVEEGDTYRLVFASAVDNVGAGPLLIEGSRADRTTAAMTVNQLIRRSDGSTRSRPVPGQLTYAGSQGAEQWQLPGLVTFELRQAPDGDVVRPNRTTGVCLGDRHKAPASEPVDGEPGRPVWTDDCGAGQPGLLVVREGISPGYGNDAAPELEGHSIDVTNVPAGRYLLVHRANLKRGIEESDYDNNAASVLIQLRRAGAIPSVRVLARCPSSETCARAQS